MNSDDPLDRLLRAAARHQPAEKEEAPFGFATRVAATWIAQRGSGGSENGVVEASLQVLWLRRALLCAVVIMTASVGWSFKTDTAAPNDEMAIASTYDSGTDLP